MKKVMYMLLAAGTLTFGACASTENTVEEGADEVEEAAEEVEEEIDEEID
ncbi:MAG: hypothetical protein LPK07_08765 [Hymenobacteraceae bacterium]|nr:hypothetical protein [Hymenobacteraceae bacterium]MDX5481761.1 hypothetical protein [Hymenobacteraceae bacterium]